MAETLFRIDDAFTIRGRGVVVTGRRAEPDAGQAIRVGDAVAIVRADGSRLRTVVRGIEPFARAHPPREWLGILLGPEVGREDIATGDEVVRDGPGGGRSGVGAPVRVDGSGDPG